ncbi:hypothetical protein [Jatrophihabitans sp.]|uniref:hypothetical protein n=1 Tax=Jatrophihabitans sp. TaxID=1932789 RepID=UPI0030C6B209
MAIARCSSGSLFTTPWIPFASLTSVRLGRRRLLRCPVHRRWELAQRVDEASLTDAERAAVAANPSRRLP